MAGGDLEDVPFATEAEGDLLESFFLLFAF